MPNLDVDSFNVPAFSVALGTDGMFRYDGFNAAAERVTGIAREARIGKAPHECMDQAKAAALVANYRRCVGSSELQEYEEELQQPAGRIWWRTTLIPRLDAEGRTLGLLAFAVEITASKRAEQELKAAALFDALTGVGNRHRFERDIADAVARATDAGRPFTVVLADVNRFKAINDTHGHAVGDAVLKIVAERLASGIRDTDRLARIGGDEFAAIISAASEGAVAVALDRMRRKLTGSLSVGTLDLIVGVSLGAALWSSGMSTADVTAAADAAMYREKATRAA